MYASDSFHNRFAVRGTHVKAKEIEAITEGADVCLDPEPDNPYDPKAIKVLAKPLKGIELVHIGYVPRELCDSISHLLSPDGPGIWNTHVSSISQDEDGTRVFVSFEAGEFIGRQAKLS